MHIRMHIHRYQFYTTGLNVGADTVLAAGKATAHAALRLWWFAEISGHRFGILYALFDLPYERCALRVCGVCA